MDSEELKVIKLEDNQEYFIVEEKEVKEVTYLLLCNIDDPEDLCIRKRVTKDNKNYIVGLSNEQELQLAIKEFAKDEE